MRCLVLLAAAACSGGSTVDTAEPDATVGADAMGAPTADAGVDAGADAGADAGSPAPRRVVAIGDLHGDLGSTKEAFRVGGVLAADDTWSGGTSVVVQVGDQLDRGGDEKEILDFLDAIQAQARAAGGDVVIVNGNHELMNVAWQFGSVTAEGFTDFGGLEGRKAAFAPGGPYALRLAERPLYAVIEGTVFLHGGILPEYVPDLAAIDASARNWMKNGGEKPAILSDADGLVWTRYYGEEETEAVCDAAEEVLAAMHIDRMVIGHTIQDNGITSICDQRVWRIDVALSDYYLPDSPVTQVLEIHDGEVKVLTLSTKTKTKQKVTRPSSPPPARR